MTTFVLVHGAFHGGWCWSRVTPLLRAGGHDVWTPTLTGCGERVHLLGPEVGLDTHVTDVINAIEYEDLRDVVLVGHSYAGTVVGCVADRIPERIGTLVYLDAFVPEDGKCMFDLQRADARAQLEAAAAEGGEGWFIPALDPRGEILAIDDPEEAEWLGRRLTAQPIKPFGDVVRLRGGSPVRRAYVYCTVKPHGSSFDALAERARHSPDWLYYEIDTHHDPMVSRPETLAGILAEIARGDRARSIEEDRPA